MSVLAEPTLSWRSERYLGCGDPQNGFAWLVCERCDGHRLVPFTCKGRAFCPCCCGRRMAERAARWCDTLFAEVPHRQWVLTVPWPRRKLLAWRPELARGVLDVALREVFGWLVAEAERQHGVVGARTEHGPDELAGGDGGKGGVDSTLMRRFNLPVPGIPQVTYETRDLLP